MDMVTRLQCNMGRGNQEKCLHRPICKGISGELENSLNLLRPWPPTMAGPHNYPQERVGHLGRNKSASDVNGGRSKTYTRS